jgi:hypothetical protein
MANHIHEGLTMRARCDEEVVIPFAAAARPETPHRSSPQPRWSATEKIVGMSARFFVRTRYMLSR